MRCEMCGSEKGPFFKADVEGGILLVCQNCASFGKVIGRIRDVEEERAKESKKKDVYEKRTEQKESKKEITYMLVPGYNNIIKNAREKLGLKQEELAKKIAERESLLHQVESGHFKPNLELARKFEKFLKIKILQEYVEEEQKAEGKKSEATTIGDLIKIK